MRYILLAYILFSCNNYLSKAQSVNQSTTVIVFEDDSTSTKTTTYKGKKVKRAFPKNNIKLGLFGPAYGTVPIYYERYIKDFLTVQAGVGLTFRDFIGDYYSRLSFGGRNRTIESDNWDEVTEFDSYDDYSSYQYRKTGFGVCFSVAPRFFVAGDAFEGFYISPSVEYAMRSLKVQNIDTDGNRLKNDWMKEKINSIYFHLNFGWQTDFDPVSLDFSFSVGFSKNKYKRQDTGYRIDDMGGTTFLTKELNYSRFSPYFRMNLDIGGIFGKK